MQNGVMIGWIWMSRGMPGWAKIEFDLSGAIHSFEVRTEASINIISWVFLFPSNRYRYALPNEKMNGLKQWYNQSWI